MKRPFTQSLQKKPLKPSDIPLDSPGRELQCLGQIQSTVTYENKTYLLTAYTIRGNTVNSFLSRPLSVEMNLVRQVDEIVHGRGHLQALGEHGTPRRM